MGTVTAVLGSMAAQRESTYHLICQPTSSAPRGGSSSRNSTSMTGHLWKLALVVALSHGYRVVGRTVGPRWAGLITALPCSTAIALMSAGSDQGVAYAMTMADACWVGVAGASLLPLAYASAIVAGWGLVRSGVLAVFAYFAVMVGVGLLAPLVGGNFPVALIVVGLATILASQIVVTPPASFVPRRLVTPAQVFWLRTVVPALCLVGVIVLGERLGPQVAGYVGAFPSVTLTGLLLTSIESGPATSVRMARALPPGNWAMVAFLGVFSQTGLVVGLIGALLLGYLAALVCLGAVAQLTALPPSPRPRARPGIRIRRPTDREPTGQFVPMSAWPRTPRRFSPLVERMAA